MHSYADRAQLHIFRLTRIDDSTDVRPAEWDVELTAALDCLELMAFLVLRYGPVLLIAADQMDR